MLLHTTHQVTIHSRNNQQFGIFQSTVFTEKFISNKIGFQDVQLRKNFRAHIGRPGKVEIIMSLFHHINIDLGRRLEKFTICYGFGSRQCLHWSQTFFHLLPMFVSVPHRKQAQQDCGKILFFENNFLEIHNNVLFLF